MKTFKQFIGEAYPQSEKKSHSFPRSSFWGALKKQEKDAGQMAPMPKPRLKNNSNMPMIKFSEPISKTVET